MPFVNQSDNKSATAYEKSINGQENGAGHKYGVLPSSMNASTPGGSF